MLCTEHIIRTTNPIAHARFIHIRVGCQINFNGYMQLQRKIKYACFDEYSPIQNYSELYSEYAYNLQSDKHPDCLILSVEKMQRKRKSNWEEFIECIYLLCLHIRRENERSFRFDRYQSRNSHRNRQSDRNSKE